MFRGPQQISRQIGLQVTPYQQTRSPLLIKALKFDVPESLKVAPRPPQETGALPAFLSEGDIAIEVSAGVFLLFERKVYVCVHAPSRCNGVHDTIFTGTCAAPATLR